MREWTIRGAVALCELLLLLGAGLLLCAEALPLPCETDWAAAADVVGCDGIP